MALEDYLVPYNARTNICFDCQNACGGCSWTAVDPKTEKIKFEPVPGWTAKEVSLIVGCYGHNKRTIVNTYHITACPQFKNDKRKRSESNDLEVTDEQFAAILSRWKRKGELG